MWCEAAAAAAITPVAILTIGNDEIMAQCNKTGKIYVYEELHWEIRAP